MKRLWLDINFSGQIGGYTNRFCLMGWQDVERLIMERNVFHQTSGSSGNPGWNPLPKPRIRIHHYGD